jgi:predicted ferric reductase
LDPKLRSGRNEEHPYTLSSAPEESALRIVVKDAGDATAALQKVSLESKALIEGPYGGFLKPGEEGQLWIAGGIGLTPFLSRARSLVHARRSADIDLIYCAQDEARAYFRPELEELATKIPGFRVHVHYFYREGPLSVDFISARCPDYAAREVYLCGPPLMIEIVRSDLVKHRVPRSRIHSEDFTWL